MNSAAILMVLVAAVGQAGSGPERSGAEGRSGSKQAQVAVSKDDAAAKSLDELKRAAGRYQIELGTDSHRQLVLVEEPVLRWTNPVRGSVAGATFLWVADGRPEVALSVFRYTDAEKKVEDNEFQSLATSGLTAKRDGQPVWAPPGPGITLAPIPGAPRPADTPVARLRQMNAIVKEFHAFFDNREDRSELRLLPKPLYRYQNERAHLIDGALFAFVVTTDPEILLMIEDRAVAGENKWHFGFARMSMVNLRATHKDRQVWRAEWAYDFRNPNEPYVTLRVAVGDN